MAEPLLDDPPLGATWSKYIVLFRYIQSLSIRSKRAVFIAMRADTSRSVDLFFPHIGITAGEFCVFHCLSQDSPRHARTK